MSTPPPRAPRIGRPATRPPPASEAADVEQRLRALGIDDAEAARLGRSRTARLRLVRAVLVLASQLRAQIDRQLAGDGLTAQQAAVMTVVRAAGRPSLRDVARVLGTSPQNVRQLVDVLVRKGFARVVEDPEDRRVRRLIPTLKNARYWAARDDSDHDELLALLDVLDTAEVERVLEALLAILARTHAGARASASADPRPAAPARGHRPRAVLDVRIDRPAQRAPEPRSRRR